MDWKRFFILKQPQECNFQEFLKKAALDPGKKGAGLAKSVGKKQFPLPVDKFAKAGRRAGGLVWLAGWLVCLAWLAWLAG